MSVKRISNDAYKELEEKCLEKYLPTLKSSWARRGLVREKTSEIKYNLEFWEKSKTEPILIEFDARLANGSSLWVYQNCLYELSGSYTKDETRLLILEYADKERQKFEKLKLKFESESAEEIKYDRPRIPEEVRVAVWRRDQGKCAQCGSRENLEYDHIIPISKGGSTTVRNIELLCEKCNREKSDKIQ